VNLSGHDGRPNVVGHRGAPLVARENTLESFAAAVAEGADIVELDVGRELLLGHSRHERRNGSHRHLADALDLLGGLGAGIQIDVKCVGIERGIVELVRARGLEQRVLVSANSARSLRLFKRLEPRIATGLGYPRDRVGAGSWRWPRGFTAKAVAVGRAIMPRRVPSLLALSQVDVLMLHRNLVTQAAVDAAHGRGVAVFAWTANDPAEVAALASLAVDGITTDDPRMALETLATLENAVKRGAE
jgi:glycerophosphoryl diester phosphodiesterase